MKPLDTTDYKILSLLKDNARMTVKQMSEHLNLSTTPIFERIKKLEKSGIIDHYTTVINHQKLGKNLQAFIHINFKEHSKLLVEQLEVQLVKLPEVEECYYVTGSSDFIVKVLVEDMVRYKEFMTNKLFEVSNIGKVETYFSLKSCK